MTITISDCLSIDPFLETEFEVETITTTTTSKKKSFWKIRTTILQR
jgi:hypothetical protein